VPLRTGSWLAERIEMHVCSLLFLTVAIESGFRIFRILTRKALPKVVSRCVQVWKDAEVVFWMSSNGC